MRDGSISHGLHRQDQHRQRWNDENRRPPKTLRFGKNEPEAKNLEVLQNSEIFSEFSELSFRKDRVLNAGTFSKLFVFELPRASKTCTFKNFENAFRS